MFRVAVPILAFFLAACGSSQEQVVITVTMPPATELPALTKSGSHPAFYFGRLPETEPEHADVQARVAARLAEGLPESVFGELSRPHERVLSSMGDGTNSPDMREGEPKPLHLVAAHLRRAAVPEDQTCDGEFYSGFAGPEPYVNLDFYSFALRSTQTHPYGLMICDEDGELAISLYEAAPPAGYFPVAQ